MTDQTNGFKPTRRGFLAAGAGLTIAVMLPLGRGRAVGADRAPLRPTPSSASAPMIP